MSYEVTTTDLGKFGFREIKMLSEILNSWVKDGLPDDFENDDVKPMMNMNSGYVFLTNSDCQVAMMNGDKLESFYSCSECGAEGFAEDINWSHKECKCGDCAPEDDTEEEEE
jgi:hypothetical protein